MAFPRPNGFLDRCRLIGDVRLLLNKLLLEEGSLFFIVVESFLFPFCIVERSFNIFVAPSSFFLFPVENFLSPVRHVQVSRLNDGDKIRIPFLFVFVSMRVFLTPLPFFRSDFRC